MTRTSSIASPASVVTVARPPSTTPALVRVLGVQLDERILPERRLQLVRALGQPPLVHEQRVREQGRARPAAGGARSRSTPSSARPPARGSSSGCRLRPQRLEAPEPERPPIASASPAKISQSGRDSAGGAPDGRGSAATGPPSRWRGPRARPTRRRAGTRRRTARASRARATAPPRGARSRARAGPDRRPGCRGADRRRSGTGRRSRGSRTPRGSGGSSVRPPSGTLPHEPSTSARSASSLTRRPPGQERRVDAGAQGPAVVGAARHAAPPRPPYFWATVSATSAASGCSARRSPIRTTASPAGLAQRGADPALERVRRGVAVVDPLQHVRLVLGEAERVFGDVPQARPARVDHEDRRPRCARPCGSAGAGSAPPARRPAPRRGSPSRARRRRRSSRAATRRRAARRDRRGSVRRWSRSLVPNTARASLESAYASSSGSRPPVRNATRAVAGPLGDRWRRPRRTTRARARDRGSAAS